MSKNRKEKTAPLLKIIYNIEKKYMYFETLFYPD